MSPKIAWLRLCWIAAFPLVIASPPAFGHGESCVSHYSVLHILGFKAVDRCSDFGMQCVVSLGPDQMEFAAHQPQSSRNSFCRNIPDIGPTIVTLDAQQDDLRDMMVEVEIQRAIDRPENSSADHFRLAPKKYKNGTVAFEFNFKKRGDYVANVTARSDDGSKNYIGRFAFSVGLIDWEAYFAFFDNIIVLFAALGLLAFLYGRWRRRSAAGRGRGR